MKRVLSLFVLALALVFPSVAAAKSKPLPIDYWAIRHGVNNVEITPDGKHVLVLSLKSKEGKNWIDIYSTGDFSKPVRSLQASKMEFFDASWVSDNVIAGRAWQKVRNKVKGPEESAWDFLLYSYDLRTNKFRKLEGDKKTNQEGNGFSIVNNLPGEPDEILITTGNEIGDGAGVDPFQFARPRSFYRYNLKTGNKKLVLKGNEKYFGIEFDGKGRPRLAQGQDVGAHEFITYYRGPEDKSWKEYGKRLDGDDYDDLYEILGGFQGHQGFVKGKPNVGITIAHNGEDKAALWEQDYTTGKFIRKIFGVPDADILGTQGHSNSWGKVDVEDGDIPIAASIYSGAKRERHWFNMEEKALFEQFERKIPHAHQISVTSRTRDGQSMIVFNVGPKDPGSYWLVQNGKMAKLGSRNPLLKPEDLADVKYVRYPARDGRNIPGYVTMPKGKGPHPLIILPHGGPHVNEVITYDEWGQFLANNGYMVLQPQYRMSVGWGRDHFDSAMGQHGLAMQDDKDDGAKYLVEKGWADPNRIAMFGWSYGGYAALVAASREPNLYQCVIAGAAVADARKVYLGRKGRATMKALNDWSKARGGYVGINPIDEVEKVNVPVMMVHPDLDARVLYFNYKDYRQETVRVAEARRKSGVTGSCSGGLEDSECSITMYKGSKRAADAVVPVSLNIPGSERAYTATSRFITLKGADHFSVTLMYRHQKKLYTEMLDFLENDCGPGGL